MYPTLRAAPESLEPQRTPFNAIADEVSRLSEQDLTPGEYYRGLLQRVLPALAAQAGAAWGGEPSGRPQLLAEVNLARTGLEGLGDLRQSHDLLLIMARDKGQNLVLSPRSAVGGAPDPSRPGNPTDYAALLVPVIVEGKAQNLLEIWTDPGQQPEQHYRMAQMLAVLAGLASTYVRNRRIRQLAGQQELWSQLEAFSRQIHASLSPLEVSYQVANEGRRLVGCDRLSVVVRGGRHAHVEAISGAEVVERRSNLVRRLAVLTDRVLDLNEKLVYTGAPDDAMPADLRAALDDFLEESGSKALTVLPVRDPRETDEALPCRSALVMECFETEADPKKLTERLDVLGKHAASALYNADEYRRIPLRWLWYPLVKLQRGLGSRGRAIAATVAGSLALILAVLVFVPYPLKMDAKGQLLPQTRAWVFPPLSGHIAQFEVEPNMDVLRDQNLAFMHDMDLESKLGDLAQEIAAADRELQASNAQLEAAAKNESERIRIGIERRKQQSTLALKIQQRNRYRELTHSDEQRPGYFWVKSPMTGTVLNADFRETLTGKYVRPADPILRVGDCNGPWEVELKIPQKHVGQVLAAYSGGAKELDVDLLLMTDPTRVYKGKLARDKIAGEAAVKREESDESEPVVIALVRVEGQGIEAADRIPHDRLVTGAEVHAKIRCGSRALGYSLFYGAWEFFFEKVVFFF